MKLKDTIAMMESSDYKIRFVAEYLQLKIRIKGLETMIDKYESGELEFDITCGVDLLKSQLLSMKAYASYLEWRAHIESIKLPKVER